MDPQFPELQPDGAHGVRAVCQQTSGQDLHHLRRQNLDFQDGKLDFLKNELPGDEHSGLGVQINDLSNKVAHIFEDGGFKPGDTVALFLDNRPEYVAIWLGLAKAGIITALINHNLRGSPLSHSINIVVSKAVIFGAEFTKGKTRNFLTK